MFETPVIEAPPGFDDGVPDDDFDGAWEQLLLDPDLEPDHSPEEWLYDEPVLTYGSCEPSGWLALDLDSATADPARLSDDTLIEAMIGFDRLASWAAARQARLLAELARRRPSDKAPYSARSAGVGSEYAPDEVGVALHLARGTACARIGLACRLLATLPDTHALWEAGQIDTSKARAIDDATVVLPDELARAVQARILDKAPEQTLAQLKAALARAVIAADPDGAEQRHRQARRDRRVVVTAEPDGMGTLWAMLTATQAAGAFTWLTRLARGLGADDPRSMDTRRADILTALLSGQLVTDPDTSSTPTPPPRPTRRRRRGGAGDSRAAGGSPSRTNRVSDSNTGACGTVIAAGPGRPIQPVTPGKPLIQIVIPYSTLIGADDQPAELVGHGPIPASLARETAADGGLAPPGHRPPHRHPARPRPRHLPPTRRARRPRPSPRPALQVPRLPQNEPPTPNSTTSPPGPTAAPPANPTLPRTAPTTTGSRPMPMAGASTPAPTDGSPGPPPPGTGTPPGHTTTDPNHPSRLRARHPHRHATPAWAHPRSDFLGR